MRRQRLSPGRTMDSQGRKVVVCDNGTGVSAGRGGLGGHRRGRGRAAGAWALGLLGCTSRPSGRRGAGRCLLPPRAWERAGLTLVSPEPAAHLACHPPQPSGLGRLARPALDAEPTGRPAATGFALSWGQLGYSGRRGKRLGLCVPRRALFPRAAGV